MVRLAAKCFVQELLFFVVGQEDISVVAKI
jgi:hypothetical protein